MTKVHNRHARILPVPEAEALQNARLERIQVLEHNQPRELVLDYHELRPSAPPILSWSDNRPWEYIQGYMVPRRLRFSGLSMIECKGLFANLDELPDDHPIRRMHGMFHLYSNQGVDLYFMMNSMVEKARLMFSARQAIPEERPGLPIPFQAQRDWSPPPQLPVRLVPNPVKLHQRYGGDPITIHLGDRAFHRRLFVGGMELQSEQRPQVGAVLNISEEPNPWIKLQGANPADRWACKGEGAHGMEIDEIKEEAQWVIDRLHRGERVLVHCQAGFNRSPTICCAVLILLEGLSAEAALERVREHHPFTRPDGHHWLALKWMARNK